MMLPKQSLRYFIVAVGTAFLVCSVIYVTSSYHKALLPHLTHYDDLFDDNNNLPLTEDDLYLDDRFAKKLFQEVKIYCWILTTKTGVLSKAAAVNYTWAPRCNKHVFFASAFGEESLPNGEAITQAPGEERIKVDLSEGKRKDYTMQNGDSFSTIVMDDIIFIDTPEGWQNLTEKSREILQLIYMTELEDFDWFLKADDDTYIIMENLRYYLKGLDSSKPYYLGYHLEPTWFDSPYMSGGAGYVFSKVGLKGLVEKGLNVKGTCREKGSFEDLEVGRCALKAGIKIVSSMDMFERETFHPDNLHDYIPGPPQQWLFYYSRFKPKGGSECCSQFTISFHRMSLQEMLIFDHLLYKTHVYGRYVPSSIKHLFKYTKLKKLPNGIPTLKTGPDQVPT